MSAYLERLVNRLIQPEAGIQPRLPGLFEPGSRQARATGPELDADASASRTETLQGKADEAEFPINAVILAEPSPKRPISPVQPPSVEQPGLKPSQPIRPATPESREMAAPEPSQQPPGEAQATLTGAAASHSLPAESTLDDPPKGTISMRKITGLHEPLTAAREALPEALLTHPADIKLMQPPEEHPVEPLLKPTQPIQTRLATPPSNAPKPAIPLIQPAQSEPGEAPQIHVTIGRIEVRAANPPPSAPRKAAARQGPVVSLDAYLKRRQGGSK
jgi:hypothetical protein